MRQWNSPIESWALLDHQWLKGSEKGAYWNHRSQYERIPNGKIGLISVNSKMEIYLLIENNEYINVHEFTMRNRWGEENKTLKTKTNQKPTETTKVTRVTTPYSENWQFKSKNWACILSCMNFQSNQIALIDKGKFFFIEELYLINIGRMMELEKHNFIVAN